MKKPLEILAMASVHDFGNTGNGNNPNGNGGQGSGGQGSGAQGQGAAIPMPVNVPPPLDDDSDALEMLINYNEMAKSGEFSEALFRDNQIFQILSVLNTKKHPNVAMTGDAGVGKTQIVEEIARRLVNKDPIVTGMLGDVIIYELPLGKIVSGSSFVGQLEEKIYSVISFVQNPKNKAILFIDEIHQIMNSDNSNTYGKIAQILKPSLGRGHMRVIGATTTQEAVTFMNDPAFSRRWSTVQIPELTPDETTQIMYHIRDSLQKHHGVLVPDSVLDQTVAIADEYKQYGSHRPDCTITLLDKAMADAKLKRLKFLEDMKNNPQLPTILAAQPKPILTTGQMKQSGLTLLTGDGKMFQQNIQKLEDTLNTTIVGQEEAKSAVIDAVKRLDLRLTHREKPVSFMFAGPSGTGKTEIAKQIALAVFGSDNRLININMSEYSSAMSMTRITGSSAGYVGSDSKQELPFDVLENNPYQVVLLDEFEKAHPDVQRFFMQALDEGSVKNARNKEIDFRRSIVIATTNAGVVEMRKNTIGFSSGTAEKPRIRQNDIIKMLEASFPTELLNRFEKIIGFTPILQEDYTKILAVKYNKFMNEITQTRKDLAFSPLSVDIEDANNIDKLVELAEQSYTPVSNGRPAEKTIREYIENTILDDPNSSQFVLL